MTNFEKYKDEILKITNKGRSIAKSKGRITVCHIYGCESCDFGNEQREGISCRAIMFNWLYEEAKPTKTTKGRSAK